MNETIIKFGYPETLIKEYNYWVVLLRPSQVTLGSLVIACKEDAESVPLISKEANQEFQSVCLEMEQLIEKVFNADKFNYLALMMVDKQVHFHFLPRYKEVMQFEQVVFKDKSWPGAPNLGDIVLVPDLVLKEMKTHLVKNL